MPASSPAGHAGGVPGGLGSIPLSDLKEYFECPVCYTVPRRPPIFQCEKGHMICGTCRPRVHNCPQCRAVYKGHRLYFAERLLEKVPVPCKYNEEGCEVELVWSRLQGHEKECTFGEVECPNTEWGCQENIVRRKVSDHVEGCQFKPVDCPVAGCSTRIGQKFLMRHLAKKHRVKQEGLLDLASLNQILLFLLVASVAINTILLM